MILHTSGRVFLAAVLDDRTAGLTDVLFRSLTVTAVPACVESAVVLIGFMWPLFECVVIVVSRAFFVRSVMRRPDDDVVAEAMAQMMRQFARTHPAITFRIDIETHARIVVAVGRWVIPVIALFDDGRIARDRRIIVAFRVSRARAAVIRIGRFLVVRGVRPVVVVPSGRGTAGQSGRGGECGEAERRKETSGGHVTRPEMGR